MEECSNGGDATDVEPMARDRCYTWPTAPAPPQLPQSVSGDSTPSCSHDTQPTPSSTLAFDTSTLTCASQSNASKKPNPWGEASYADLITQALLRAPGGRLKLNEVYQWFSDNIEYFAQRSSPEAAAGWKVRLLHCLSLACYRTKYTLYSWIAVTVLVSLKTTIQHTSSRSVKCLAELNTTQFVTALALHAHSE